MAPNSNPTLRDVANAAGVSPMTASRALSGQAKVSPAKRDAVLAAAAKLGYQVNPIVRGVMSEMRRRKTNQFVGAIAFLNTSREELAWHAHPYNRPYLEGAKAQATASGFALDEIWVGQPGWSPSRTRKVLNARGIRGFIISPGGTPEQLDFDLADYAVAAFGGLSFIIGVHQVLPDYYQNYVTAYNKLWKIGYRRIGLFCPEYDAISSENEIIGGFLSAQWRTPKKYHVPIGHGPDNWQVAETAFIKWFQRYRPDAIMINFNMVPHWLEKIGVSIPRDVGLAHPLLSHDAAGWSGVEIRSRLQGAHAVDLITAQILRNESGLPTEPKRLVIPGRWVGGNTTRPQ
ncbi:MAG: LacI family transcriptional regulator [Puniceicoccaceae bacterium]|nr:MAG: LacI family transcriptional regulator [Puniceicoccaceae bacterium]